MSDQGYLPKIKVTDAQNGSGASTSGGHESTDTGQVGRPRSTTSSEGNAQLNGKKLPNKAIKNIPSKESTGDIASSPPAQSAAAIDPISHHILKRTNTEHNIPQKLRTSGADASNTDLGSPTSPDAAIPGRQLTPEIHRSDSNIHKEKEKKKGVSFLSRFSIIGGKKKDPSEDADDDESELGDQRTEGMNAHVFSSSIDANGFIPQHKEPPRYIKVRKHNKKAREFNRMFLSQELSGNKIPLSNDKLPRSPTVDSVSDVSHKLTKTPKPNGAIWAMEWSKDGRYLAAAGRDQVVRVWAVISTPEERQAHEYEEDVSSLSSGTGRLSAPVFRSKPVREFEGHTSDILDVSWSKNNFLLSSSMDKTVRLWHVSRQECLCTFKHKDFVTSIAFHPKDDRFFLAGSLDSILRLWSIPDKSVAFWNQLPDLITAVAFTPDGKTAIAGVLSGLCLFYETEGLKYHTQIHVKSSRGKNSKGSKITGIRTADDLETGETKLLITSNDSRIRLYNLRDKSLEMKFRGHENTSSQINASFSDDGRYVICGSEDRKAYIWNTMPQEAESKDKPPVEMFCAHSDMVTTAIMAPTATRQLLSGSGDPIYDLCNPPPVTLLSREESNASSIPVASEKRDSYPRSEPNTKKKIEESPAYLARTTHKDGLIIVTSDYQGIIKCFRLDCAFEKRHQWDGGSTFSKKKGVIPRSGSIMTQSSVGSASGRMSQTSLNNNNGGHEHILSWRSHVDEGSASTSIKSSSRYNDRSISPGKFNRASFTSNTTSQNNLASAARQQPYAGANLPSHTQTTTTTSSVSTSPPPSIYKATTQSSTQPPTPGFSLYPAKSNNTEGEANNDPLSTAGKSNNSFWNISGWKSMASGSSNNSNRGDPGKSSSANNNNPSSLRPPMADREISAVSRLSSEEEEEEREASARAGNRNGNDGPTEGDGQADESEEGETLNCGKCNGRDFRARRITGRKTLVMVCTKCGTNVE